MSKNVDRTLDFIELFARERKPLSLSEISRSLAYPGFELSRCTAGAEGTRLHL